MLLELNHLKVFFEVAKAGRFTEAAQRLSPRLAPRFFGSAKRSFKRCIESMTFAVAFKKLARGRYGSPQRITS